MPSVSVIIPAYNAAFTLERAVQSALSQTGVTLEIVIVDDGSHDETWDIICRMAKADRRIRTARHEANQGPSAARNRALGLATGDWIAILDADDSFAPGRLSRLLRQAEDSGADLIADNQQLFDQASGKLLGLAFPPPWMGTGKPVSLVDLAKMDMPGEYPVLPIGYLKPIIRREFIRSNGLVYDVNISIGEDFLFYVKSLLCGGKLFLTPEAAYLTSIPETSLSRGDESVPIKILNINGYIRTLLATARSDEKRVFNWRHHGLRFEVARSLLRRGMRKAAVKEFLRLNPLYVLDRAARAARRRLVKTLRRVDGVPGVAI